MTYTALFFINSALLGAGLAADAFSVSVVNGLSEPGMRRSKMLLSASVFAVFQGIMPMAGYLAVHTAVSRFSALSAFVPWIALVLLVILGSRMLFKGLRGGADSGPGCVLTPAALLLQGVATSIDALSVGFVISDYSLQSAVLCSAMIAAVTFAICASGTLIGRKAGARLSGRASVLGGIILIAIGAEILLTGLF